MFSFILRVFSDDSVIDTVVYNFPINLHVSDKSSHKISKDTKGPRSNKTVLHYPLVRIFSRIANIFGGIKYIGFRIW